MGRQMGMSGSTVTKSRHLAVVVAIALALALPSFAAAEPGAKRAEPVKIKRQSARAPGGHGFLPGYEPQIPNSIPVVRGYGVHWSGPRYPRYWSRGRWLYGFGPPGFYRGRWNGGSIGPCYTQTPIGPMWNCGR
jgi:hypothetical protein